jgi:phosphate uptake regulator
MLDEMLGRSVGGAYKAGYDEIKIRFESSKQLSEIQRVIARNCFGFEIIEQSAHHVIAKEVSMLSPEEFDNVLRRLFLFLLQSADSSLSAAEKNDYESLRAIIVADDSINRLSDFCRRLINRNRCKSFKRPAPLYSIVENLERIGDSYKEICRIISDKKQKVNPEILLCHKLLNGVLRKFYETFYSFELSNLEEFGFESRKTLKAIEKQIDEAKHSDYGLFSELKIAAEKIFEMNSSLIALRI